MGGTAWSEPIAEKTESHSDQVIDIMNADREKEGQSYKMFDTIFKNKTTGKLVKLTSPTEVPAGYYECDENGKFTGETTITETLEVEKMIDFEVFKKLTNE